MSQVVVKVKQLLNKIRWLSILNYHMFWVRSFNSAASGVDDYIRLKTATVPLTDIDMAWQRTLSLAPSSLAWSSAVILWLRIDEMHGMVPSLSEWIWRICATKFTRLKGLLYCLISKKL